MASNKRKYEFGKTFEVSARLTTVNVGDEKIVNSEVKELSKGVKYRFQLRPKLLESPYVFLFLEIPDKMRISVDVTFSYHSIKSSRTIIIHTWNQFCTQSGEYCTKLCSKDDFSKIFKENSCINLIVKANFTFLKVDDFLTKKAKIESILGPKLWENESGKDAKIIVGGKEIKVHKSEVKDESGIPPPKIIKISMPNSDSKHDTISINNYGFKVVEKAVMCCYDFDCFQEHGKTINLAAEDAINLFKFAQEFEINDLKEKIEEFCIENLSASNACIYTNSSITIKAEKLYHKCFDFLLKSMIERNPVDDIEKLDAGMKEKIFLAAFAKA
uniref:BTB domain-containing protein n=1 Tax=Panagrolaimus sp. PS1159 TaxID=55785 RepID=A0AC35F9M6_9BILA